MYTAQMRGSCGTSVTFEVFCKILGLRLMVTSFKSSAKGPRHTTSADVLGISDDCLVFCVHLQQQLFTGMLLNVESVVECRLFSSYSAQAI